MALYVLTYDDGRDEEVNINLAGLVAAERKLGDLSQHSVESSLFAAWVCLGKPPPNFDKWLETVSEINPATAATEDPTQPAPGTAS